MTPPPGPLETAWARTRRDRASAQAVIDGDGRTTSVQALAQEADVLAKQLPTRGLGPFPIAVHLPNGAHWLAWYLAILARGQVLLPIDPQHSDEAARALAEKLGAALFVSDGGACPGRSPRPAPAGAHLVKLTSASTGAPKALFFGQPEMRADGEQIIAGMGLRADDRHLAVVPFGHSYGLGNLVMPLLLQGATLVCPNAFWPRALLGAISRHQLSVLPLVPPLVRALARLGPGAELPDSVRLVLSAGGLLPPETARLFTARHGRPIHNFYGSSETGGIAFDASGEATAEGRSVGRPLPGVAIRLRRDGTLSVRSPAVLRAEPGRGPAARQIVSDEAERLANGELRLLGRRDDVVKIGGRRIVPGAIAEAIRQFPGVEDVVVVPMAGERDEPRLAALVATTEPLEAIQREARQRLVAWQRPQLWAVCDAIPYNSRGKPDRTAAEALLTRSNTS